MSADIHIRTDAQAGRITLTRPQALNALTYDMAMAIDQALQDWATDDDIRLVVIDAEGTRAFCSGGDIQDLYDKGRAGDFAYGQAFWRDEYRLNDRLAEFPKPIISLMQGFTMGGGVGIGCHASHRVVGDSSQIAMPECGIGLVPDVGGSLLLARAPGRLGDYLGLSAARMGPGDAIHAGFADHYLPEAEWPALVATLIETGDAGAVARAAQPAPASDLAAKQAVIDRLFDSGDLPSIAVSCDAERDDLAVGIRKALLRNSPLSMACTLKMLGNLRESHADLRAALTLEYRFTARAMEHGDFLEGIRAQIIERDRKPRWKHALISVPEAAVERMLAPLGAQELSF
ncbi:enoyl-CoA hydratase/isomerase family protein [Pseudooceanicola sp.]|uniref:enoyl-CoA hydratase/isomerase family protein n=1 Tax=Pseudooceanicola sp. TaxID=1914328 RepID=UPI002613D11E|nr:enoyl-CoA hydratase/isomerase family protein [Pseudooceanicola sp.]MDF1855479.1 enoyl-CoA hydratase/isomerase family protein [Pseudooceanicola sp.]